LDVSYVVKMLKSRYCVVQEFNAWKLGPIFLLDPGYDDRKKAAVENTLFKYAEK